MVSFFNRHAARIAAGAILLFLLFWWKAGLESAVVLVGGFIAGYFAWFDGLRAALEFLSGNSPGRQRAISGALGLAACIAMGMTKSAPLLILFIGVWAIIDVSALLFRG